MLDTLMQDVRYAARMLRKNPGFTLVVILTLMLGIGANTAIFNVVNAVLLRPLPFAHPERLVSIYEKSPEFGQSSVSYLNFLDWQKQTRSFESLALWQERDFNLTGTGEAAHLQGVQISASFFSTFGVQPLVGRDFREEDDRLGAGPVVLISERLWRNRFAASPEITSKIITLNGKNYSIAGVIPATYRFYRENDAYVPIGQWDEPLFRDRTASMGSQVVGELKSGVTLEQARADTDAISASLAAAYPDSNKGKGTIILPMRQDAVGDLQKTLLVLLGAVGLVLLIACANVANLLLARSSGRTREFAIRAALGAGRGRVIRQVLTESVMLAAVGGGLGVLLAAWGTSAALKFFPKALPGYVTVDLDYRVLGFALAASLLTGILFGLAPAWKTSRPNLQETLKEGGRGVVGGSHRTQSIFIVSEIALALVLLVGASLLLRSLNQLWNVKPGFDAHNVLTFQVAFPRTGEISAPLIREKERQLVEKLRAVPGVESASIMFGSLPMQGDSELPLWVEGQPKPATVSEMQTSLMYGVGPEYLRTMRIPLIRGRELSEHDGPGAPLVVDVDEEFAKAFLPGQDPIGKHVNLVYLGQAEIVGVVGHVKHWSLDGDDHAKIRAQFYFNSNQTPDQLMSMAADGALIVMRTSVPPAGMVDTIRHEVSAIDSREVVYGVKLMDEIVSDSLVEQRFSAILLGAFACVALLLATVGIYGVVSYLVNQRVHEVGIRMALGARPGDILRIVLGQGGRMALIGIGIGLAASFGLTRLIARLLFGVSATDPLTFAGVALLLLGIALMACYIPARRAMHVDPMVALRYE